MYKCVVFSKEQLVIKLVSVNVYSGFCVVCII